MRAAFATIFFLIPLFALGGEHGGTVPRGKVAATCDFLNKSTATNPNARERWAYEAVGIDLLAKHAAFRDLTQSSFDSFKVGVVDTGLKTRGNPAAQASAFVEGSPEKDDDGHGTNTVGVIASQYGVEPRLRVEMFSVASIKNAAPGHGGLGGIPEALEKAVKDPKVKIINLSLETRNERVAELVEEATQKGKIVIVAAGNSGMPLTSWRSQFPRLRRNPRLLEVGALNPWGVPSSFSNYGADVDVYAPGVEVKTLAGRYDPIRSPADTADFASGTSFAAPMVAGVLGKLAAAFPKLALSTLLRALKFATISREGEPRIPQFNPLLAAELIHRGLDCLSGAGTDAAIDACLKGAESKIVSPLPAVPSRLDLPKDCDLLETYESKLREGFLLTRGSRPFGRALMALYTSLDRFDDAARFFFSPAGTEGLTFGLSPPQTPKHPEVADEQKHTGSYHRGEKAMPAEIGRHVPEFRSALDAKRWKEAARHFLEFCGDHLFKSPIEDCHRLIPHESSFLSALAEAVRGSGKPILNGMAFYGASGEVVKPIANQLAEGWLQTQLEWSNMPRTLVDWMPFMDLKTQEKLVQAFAVRKPPIPEVHAEALASLKRKLTQDEERVARREASKTPKASGVRFALLRRRAGQLSAADAVSAIGDFYSSKEIDYPLPEEIFSAMRSDPELARLVLTNETRWLAPRSLTEVAQLAKQVLKPDELGKVLLRISLGVAAGRPEEVLDLLEKHGDVAELSALQRELASGPAKDPKLAALSAAFAKRQATLKGASFDHIKRFLEESPLPMGDKVGYLPTDIVLADPKLAKWVESELLKETDFPWARWLARAQVLTPQVESRLAQRFLPAVDEGANEMTGLLERVSAPLREKWIRQLVEAPKSEKAGEDFRKRRLTVLADFSKTPDAERALRKVPGAVEAVVGHFRETAWGEIKLPAFVSASLKTQLPKAADLGQDLPGWLKPVLLAHPEEVAWALDAFAKAKDKSLRTRLSWLIQEVLAASPDEDRRFRMRADFESWRKALASP